MHHIYEKIEEILEQNGNVNFQEKIQIMELNDCADSHILLQLVNETDCDKTKLIDLVRE